MLRRHYAAHKPELLAQCEAWQREAAACAEAAKEAEAVKRAEKEEREAVAAAWQGGRSGGGGRGGGGGGRAGGGRGGPAPGLGEGYWLMDLHVLTETAKTQVRACTHHSLFACLLLLWRLLLWLLLRRRWQAYRHTAGRVCIMRVVMW